MQTEHISWSPGLRIGQYTLVKPIGAGGMAEVWLAFVEGAYDFKKPIALKRLNLAHASDRQFIDMFLDEAALVSRLTHPGIVQVLELGEVSGSLFVAMEYLAGENVSALMRAVTKAGRALPFEVAVKLGADTAEALHYAHTRLDEGGGPLGVVHRDVSPHNLMVTYEGIVKVLDFGIAKAAQRRAVTETGQMKGKLGYIAPEQARGEAVDARADQFALGVVMFELVTGTRLYEAGASEWDLFRKVAASSEPFESPHARNPAVPEALSRVIARAMARDPAARFESVEAFRLALLETVPALPTSAQLAALMQELFAEGIAGQKTLVMQLRATKTSAPAVVEQPRRRGRAWLALVAVVPVVGLAAFMLRPKPVAPVRAVVEPVVVKAPEPVEVADAGAPEVVEEEPVKPAPRPAKKHEAKKGTLTLKTKPWSEVFLGARRLGETPLVEVPLPAGTHRLKLVNPQRGAATYLTVEVVAGQLTTKSLTLE
ncbi:MAG: serine/threonine protein kinase [Myxococcaceae bacterium]|nr:serine/threonine protein kinase [Myxococcaceae bacterium]